MRPQDLETLEKGHGHATNGHAYTNGYHKQPPVQQRKKSELWSPANIRALTYGAMNVVSASGIVFANKYVFVKCGFPFTYALTWIHTVFTLVGMAVCARCGMFETKRLPASKLIPIAIAYVAYIVLGNLSLNVNTVGFYQVMKIAVAPTVIALELIMFRTLPNSKIMTSVGVVCMGIAVATVNDSQLIRNLWGLVVGFGATLTTALYQIWAGSKQKELKASSMQLLHAYTPHSTLILGLMVPLLEPVGWGTHAQGTLMGYDYTRQHVTAILVSSALGLMVSLSTFLFIGATSSLTYNVVGHMKTVIILTGGCLFFGDSMPPKKFTGVCIAMVGIIWYTHLKIMGSGGGGGQQKQQQSDKMQLPALEPRDGRGMAQQQGSNMAHAAYHRPTLTGQGGRRHLNNAQALNNMT